MFTKKKKKEYKGESRIMKKERKIFRESIQALPNLSEKKYWCNAERFVRVAK